MSRDITKSAGTIPKRPPAVSHHDGNATRFAAERRRSRLAWSRALGPLARPPTLDALAWGHARAHERERRGARVLKLRTRAAVVALATVAASAFAVGRDVG